MRSAHGAPSQATAAGLAVAFSGVVNDLGSSLALAGAFGDAVASPVAGYTIVYAVEIFSCSRPWSPSGRLSAREDDYPQRATIPSRSCGRRRASIWRTRIMRGAIGNLDVAQIVLYAFWLFFAGLIFYLRREDRREGYPLESEGRWALKARDIIWIPAPKTFLRWDGQKVTAPNYKADDRPINATKTEPWPGAPLTPTGDPLLANVGPGSYAQRAGRCRTRPPTATTSSRPCASRRTSRCRRKAQIRSVTRSSARTGRRPA